VCAGSQSRQFKRSNQHPDAQTGDAARFEKSFELMDRSGAFRSGVGLVLTALLVPPLLARIHSEEILLREHFGDAYNAYCSRTWRLIPGIY
jgi:hypothetical protein